ncbi:MAG: hypothetical protein WEE89_13215 [Gemmatimonadota bacterium]
MRYIKYLLVMTLLVGCNNAKDESAGDRAAPAAEADTTGMPMQGMPTRAVGSGVMMEQMQQAMKMMETAGADSVHALMPMHRQMADQMLAQMKKEMEGMKMPLDAGWSALMDSVHQDMAAMSGMAAGTMSSAMQAQHARMTRLMDMHRRMMQQQTTTR